MPIKTVLQFDNPKGQTLRGILYSPENSPPSTPKTLFIFPNGGVMGAEGDYRAYVSIAKLLVDKGYYVFRFSPAGLGFSDGEIPDCPQKNLFNQIENGLFVDDIKTAIKFINEFEKFTTNILIGVCGGAISSFLAAADIKEVDSVIPIGIPVILDDPEMDYDQRILSLDKAFVTRMYIDKIFSLDSWIKLLSGKLNPKPLFNMIKVFFSKKEAYLSDDQGNSSKFLPNPLFFNTARKLFKQNKRILFVFGDTDGFWWEFQTLFLNKYFGNTDTKPFYIYISKNSNHMLSLPEMQSDVSRYILSWIDSKD